MNLSLSTKGLGYEKQSIKIKGRQMPPFGIENSGFYREIEIDEPAEWAVMLGAYWL